MCLDYDSGGCVTFGRAGGPVASLSEAVVASCSVSRLARAETHWRTSVRGWRNSFYHVSLSNSLPKPTSTRCTSSHRWASYETDRSHNPSARGERLLRHFYTAALTREIAKVRAAGTEVAVLTPGPEDLAAIGGNLMDSGRRERVVEASLQTSPRQLAELDRRRRVA